MTVSCFGRVAGLVLLLALAGCGKSGGPRSGVGHPLPASHLVARCEPGTPGGRLVIAVTGTPATFNPLFAYDEASDAATRLLFGSLVNLDQASQEVRPGLAESWSVTPDGKTWTFNLRHDVRWSDRRPLTADDVVFTWNSVMLNPRYNRVSYELFRINGTNFDVSKVDDFTVRVVTPVVFAPFLEYFGGVAILPKHALEASVSGGGFQKAYAAGAPAEWIVGCGPYRLKEFQPNKSPLLERNPEYWVADSTGQRLPYFDKVLLVSCAS